MTELSIEEKLTELISKTIDLRQVELAERT